VGLFLWNSWTTVFLDVTPKEPMVLARGSCIFVESSTLVEALQFLLDNSEKIIDIMCGIFTGLDSLALMIFGISYYL
jgi:hypothetical protein